jgi:hypothetical protein
MNKNYLSAQGISKHKNNSSIGEEERYCCFVYFISACFPFS